MSKPLPLSDFRAVRVVLEPDDFAFGPKTERAPSDLIDEDTWHNIMDLPDDVAIRTSNHHGSQIRQTYKLGEAWLDAIGDDRDALYETMVDTIDEFDSVTFNSLHGFYRQAISSLRNALELVTIGAYSQACDKWGEFSQWREGKRQMRFDTCCTCLNGTTAAKSLNSYLQRAVQDSIFQAKSGPSPAGWARRLHAELSNFTHSRPSFTNADLWASSGPIYERQAYQLTMDLLYQAYGLCYVMVKLARPGFALPAACEQLFEPGDIAWKRMAHAAHAHLFGGAR